MKILFVILLFFIGCTESNYKNTVLKNDCLNSDLPCDVIYKAVVLSLENAINKEVKPNTETVKIVDGIVETIKLAINIDEDSELNRLLVLNNADEMQKIIELSLVGEMFSALVKILK